MLADRVENFIHRRFSKDTNNWLDGNCYYFAIILKERFGAIFDIYYLPIRGHFIVGTKQGEYFDWTGQVYPEEIPILYSQLWDEDKRLYERLERDCVF